MDRKLDPAELPPVGIRIARMQGLNQAGSRHRRLAQGQTGLRRLQPFIRGPQRIADHRRDS